MRPIEQLRGKEPPLSIPSRREDFEPFAREWLPCIRRFAYVQLGGDPEACEEVQQESLIALYQGRDSFRGDSEFSTYLYRLVRNKAADHIRKERRRRRLLKRLDEESERRQASEAADPSETVTLHDENDRLWSLIQKLPERDRSIIFLREIEGLGEKESATILGIPVGTMKSRLHRIKKILYESMLEGDGSWCEKKTYRLIDTGLDCRSQDHCETTSTDDAQA
jgi:RNA polymerase sigma-70 factor (ECF subfamily)